MVDISHPDINIREGNIHEPRSQYLRVERLALKFYLGHETGSHTPYVAKTLPRRPTKTETGVVGHPPPFSNTVKTSCAETFCGDIWLQSAIEVGIESCYPHTTTSGIRIAKKPVIWRMRMKDSSFGRILLV